MLRARFHLACRAKMTVVWTQTPSNNVFLGVNGADGQRQLAESKPGVSVAGGQRGLAESELRVYLSMGRKIIEIPKGNEGFRGSVGLTDSAELAESELRVYLSMGRRIIEIPEGNEGFQGSVGLADSSGSQNLSLGYTSV